MTLKNIENIPREYLWAKEIAPLLDSTEDTICWQAKHEPEKLGFPVIVTGKHVRIPKAGFIFYMLYGRPVFNVELRPETLRYQMDQSLQTLFERALEKP